MTDRELLERCAKVMGKTLSFDNRGDAWDDATGVMWMPTEVVSDAADLAIKCKVDVRWFRKFGRIEAVWVDEDGGDDPEMLSWVAKIKDHPTETAAYCYAICLVVAQMDGGM